MKKCILQLIITFLVISGCSKTDDISPYEEGKIIILMYHRITEGEATNLYERCAADFEADLMYLINNKINVISFNDLESVKKSGKMPEGHSAILSFDDGDRSGFNTVMPLLMKYRMNATFLLWAEMIGRDSFLTWEEVMYMSYLTFPGGIRPFTFGSHSYSHQFLHGRKQSFSTTEEYFSFLDYELGISKNLIESYIPGAVEVLALPFGDGAGDPDIIAAAQRNGYRFIRTSINSIIGEPDLDLFCLPGLPMLDQTDPEEIGYYLFN